MPQEKNTAVRILVPLVVTLAGLFVAYSVWKGTNPPPKTPASTAPAPGASAPSPASPSPSSADAKPTPGPSATGEAAAKAPLGLSMAEFAGDPLAMTLDPLGSLEAKDNPARMRVEFSATGAGIARLRLADHFEHVDKKEQITIQGEVSTTDAEGRRLVLTPFSALAIAVGVEEIGLAGEPGKPVWRQVSREKPGAFEAFVVDAEGRRVLRITRTYRLGSVPYAIDLEQRVENLAGAPVKVRWYQMGPVDLSKDELAYVGDRRRLRFGYLLDAVSDPTRSQVLSSRYLIPHQQVVMSDKAGNAPASLVQWPNKASEEGKYTLVWGGLSNRYFGAAFMPLIDAGATEKAFPWIASVNRAAMYRGPDANGTPEFSVGLRLDSVERTLGPAGTKESWSDFSQGIFAGPLAKADVNADPRRKALGLDGLIVYNMGGPCAVCTFDWLTSLLLGLLRFLHDRVWSDWALAIITLVVVVRTILHPVTRWSQIRMTRFGKQMQGIGPKMKVLQERYKDDPKKLQAETARLWREEGISPAGFLGCVPMFLQMPVWIALYATLFFAVELRHEGAFYGLFQAIQPAKSPFSGFLADLSEPDRFIHWGQGTKIPLLGFIGPISSLNVLPLLLGVVFFIQQKYLTPPATSTLTPEQEMQQKMMKWMTVFMFPLFMYNAPSGLALYFITNSTIAIFESKYIRSHIDKYERKNPPGSKKKSGKGFMARVMEAAEARQRALEQQRAQAERFPGRKRV